MDYTNLLTALTAAKAHKAISDNEGLSGIIATLESDIVKATCKAIAEIERQAISARIKSALKIKKEELAKEGKKLGGPKIEKARKQASKVNKQRFTTFRAKTGPKAFSIRKELEAEGKKSTFQAIANLMNERGIKTMSGKPWSPSGVMQMMKAYKRDSNKNK